MTTFSAGDLSDMRDVQASVNPYLYVHSPTALMTARINDGSMTRGKRTIAYDAGVGDDTYIRTLQEVWVGTAAGKKDIGVLLIRNAGSIGLPTGSFETFEHPHRLVDDAYLTFWDHRPIFRLVPRIDIATKVWYKQYNVAFPGANYLSPPVCVAGVDQIGWLSSGSYEFDLDLSDSYPMQSGASIVSYACSVAPSTGASLSFNTGTGIGTLTVTQAGYWWLDCSVTDSLGLVGERFVLCVAESKTATVKADFSVTGVAENQGQGGQATLKVWGDNVNLSYFPDNAIFMLWYDGYLDGEEVDTFPNVLEVGDGQVLHGYLRSDSTNDQVSRGTNEVTFRVTTGDQLIGNLPLRSTTLRAEASPSAWWEYPRSLTTGRAIHFYLYWHTTVLQRHDVLGLSDNVRKRLMAEFPQGTVLQACNRVAYETGYLAKLQADRLSRLHLVEDPLLLNDTRRAALDIIMDIEEDDVTGPLRYIRDHEAKVHTMMMGGFDFNADPKGTVIGSIIPGYRESGYSYAVPYESGSGANSLTTLLLESQTDSNEKIGRLFAQQNRTLREVIVDFRPNMLSALTTIGSYGWYRAGLANSDLAREIDINEVLMVCERYQIELGTSGTPRITAYFQPFQDGPDGIQWNYPDGVPEPPQPSDPGWEILEEGYEYGLLAVGSAYFRLFSASDWDDLSISDTILSVAVDPWWTITKQSSNPVDAIWLFITSTELYRVDFLITLPNDITPGVDPPDTFSDTPTPTADDLTFVQIMGDLWVQKRFYLLVNAEIGGEWRTWLGVSDSWGSGFAYYSLAHGSVPDELKGIRMAVNDDNVLVTAWRKDGATEKLVGIRFNKSLLVTADQFDLGNCSESELDTFDYIAYPFTVVDDPAFYGFYGRMDTPGEVVGASDPEHIIETDDNGSTFSSVENGRGSSVIKALVVGPDSSGDRDYYAMVQG